MKNHISTCSNLRLKYFIFAFFVGFGVLFLGCKPKEEVIPDSKFVKIPDVNFEKALIQLKIDDIQDGKVLMDSILKIKGLTLSFLKTAFDDYPISSLSGIESFANLEFLKCENQRLISLDISKNTKLRILQCSNSGLTNLDVSKNVLLTFLNCRENSLSTLDLSKNVKLTDLYCMLNKLSNLDISNNIMLKYLNFGSNQITNLDISKNTFLEWLSCYNSQLINLDVSKNSLLIHFYCDGNKLSSLDLSKNSILKFMTCTDNKIQTICVNNLNQVKPDWIKDPTATYKVCP